MAKTQNYLAIDLGAESGRVILGFFDGKRLDLHEVHRFPNTPVGIPSHAGRISLHWDILRLWSEIKQGIGRAVHQENVDVSGIGLDTWGVDFGLLDKSGTLVGNPYYYRDNRTDGMLEEAFQRVPREEIFEQTGIQFMQINTLYQLLSMVLRHAPELETAKTFLTMPDIFNFWLTGQAVCEFTNATTTQCYDPRRRTWADALLKCLGIPRRLFPPIVPPGTILSGILKPLGEELGTHAAVITPACHDTGSAIAAIPAADDHYAWISSGTWSIMGTNVKEPVINAQSLANNFTNEGGVGGTYRFSKNIMGLWLVQECRRTWAAAGEEYTYAQLTEMAGSATPFTALVDPDCVDFLHPGNMPERIRNYCQRTGQNIPTQKGEIVRCALESIALKYRYVLERLEKMTASTLQPIHIVGGGTQNRLLNQFTADATNRRVITGPIEATAIGNILTQAIALGHIPSGEQGRQIVQNSCDMAAYEPGQTAAWDEIYPRFCNLVER